MSSQKDPHPNSRARVPQHPTHVYEYIRKHNQIRNNEYHLIKLLGEGGFAKCYKTKRTSDEKFFAIKAINLNEKADANNKDKHKVSRRPRVCTQQKAYAEANFLKICNHPNIIRYETHFIYESVFYIVMEYCSNGSVGDMLKSRKTITEVEARYYLQQMVHGLTYLKQKSIIHRDLKPANYLLTEELQLKIADFGLATGVKYGSPVFMNICGTPNYLSPEMLEKRSYSYEVDVWSLGVALYAMLYGLPPFETKKKDAKETYDKIKKCDYSFSSPSDKIQVSSDAQDLISKILIIDPSKRIPLDNILDHPFMSAFHIPRSISYKCLKKEPESRFLRNYEQKIKEIHENYRGKSEPSKQKSPKKFNQQRESKKPMRYCPPEFTKEQRHSKSFTDSGTFKYQRGQDIPKKQLKKIKSGIKFNQEQNESKRPKSMGDAMKKIQKEEMLTSSPISSDIQIKSLSQHKYLPYPSELQNQQISLVQIKKQSCATSNIYYDLPQSQGIKDVVASYQQINCEDEKGQQTEKIPFPLFEHMMKPLSFGKFSDYRDIFQSFRFDREEISRAMLRDKVERKGQKANQGKSASKQRKIQLQNSSNTVFPSLLETNIFSLQDFMLFTSSLHLKSQKIVKMVYCLKQESSLMNANQMISPKNPLNPLNSTTKFIGSIFFDNSSIVTKISQSGNQLKCFSVYIKNVEVIKKNRKIILENIIDENDQQNYIDNRTNEDWFAIELDLFGKQKDLPKANGQNNDTDKQQINYDVKLKMKFAKDGIKLFKNHLQKTFPQLFTHKKQSQSIQITTKYPTETSNIDDFKFIHMFRSRQSSLYFEVSDGSKHYLEKRSTQKNHLDLFRKNSEPKMKSYRYAMYFSVEKSAFLRDVGQEKFKMLSMTELKDTGTQKKTEPRLKYQRVKDLQSESDECSVEKVQKKIKINEQGSQSLSSHKSNKLQQKSKCLSKLPQTDTLRPADLLTKICNEFRQKMDMICMRERDSLKAKHKQQMPQAKSKSKLEPGIQLRENRYCGMEIQNGMFEFKLKRETLNH